MNEVCEQCDKKELFTRIFLWEDKVCTMRTPYCADVEDIIKNQYATYEYNYGNRKPKRLTEWHPTWCRHELERLVLLQGDKK